MKVFSITAVVALFAAQTVLAATTASPCDPTTCKLPNCLCPSLTPPNGLQPKDVPQFVTITFDDSVQAELLATAQDIMNVK